MDSEAAISFLFAALVAPAIAVMPAWLHAVRRWGKRRSLVVASALFVAAAVALVGTGVAAGPWVYPVVAVAGVGYAGLQMLPLSMLPDVVADDEARTGKARAGAFSGVWTAAETVSMALGAAIVLAVLGATGFASSAGGDPVSQTDLALGGIVVAFAVVPAALVLVSLLTLRRYPLH